MDLTATSHHSLIGRLSRVDPLVRHQGVLPLHHLAAVGARELGLLVLRHVELEITLVDEDAAHRARNLFQFLQFVGPLALAGNAQLDVLFQVRTSDLPLTRGAFDGAGVLRVVHVLDEIFGQVVQFVTFGAFEVGPEMVPSPVHVIGRARIERRFAEFAGNLSFSCSFV